MHRYKGPLCSVCCVGFYKLMLSCRSCPSTTWIIGQSLLCSLALGTAFAFLWWSGKRKAKNSNRNLRYVILSNMKIVIGFRPSDCRDYGCFCIYWMACVLGRHWQICWNFSVKRASNCPTVVHQQRLGYQRFPEYGSYACNECISCGSGRCCISTSLWIHANERSGTFRATGSALQDKRCIVPFHSCSPLYYLSRHVFQHHTSHSLPHDLPIWGRWPLPKLPQSWLHHWVQQVVQ